MPQLKITFCGLFLYVVRDRGSLVVLAPQTGHDRFGAVEKHAARLVVPSRQPKRYDIGGYDIDIPAPTDPFIPPVTLPNELAQVTSATGQSVPTERFSDNLSKKGCVYTRIRIPAGAPQPLTHTPVDFRFGSAADQKLTHAFVWSTSVPSPLIIKFKKVGGKPGTITVPATTGGDYEIVIAHVPVRQGSAHKLQRGMLSHDFVALYSLYEPNIGAMPVPVVSPLYRSVRTGSASTIARTLKRTIGGDPVTCVGGEG